MGKSGGASRTSRTVAERRGGGAGSASSRRVPTQAEIDDAQATLWRRDGVMVREVGRNRYYYGHLNPAEADANDRRTHSGQEIVALANRPWHEPGHAFLQERETARPTPSRKPTQSPEQKAAIQRTQAHLASLPYAQGPAHSDYGVAKSELARYKRGDLAMPAPAKPPAKESAQAERQRHIGDQRRLELWLEHGPGKEASFADRRQAHERIAAAYEAQRAASRRGQQKQEQAKLRASEREAQRQIEQLARQRVAEERKQARDQNAQARKVYAALAKSKPYEAHKLHGPVPVTHHGVTTTINLQQPTNMSPKEAQRFAKLSREVGKVRMTLNQPRTPQQQREDTARNSLRVRTLAGRVHDAEIDHQHSVLAVRATEPGSKAYEAARTRAKAVYARQESLRAEMNRAYQDELAKLNAAAGAKPARAPRAKKAG